MIRDTQDELTTCESDQSNYALRPTRPGPGPPPPPPYYTGIPPNMFKLVQLWPPLFLWSGLKTDGWPSTERPSFWQWRIISFLQKQRKPNSVNKTRLNEMNRTSWKILGTHHSFQARIHVMTRIIQWAEKRIRRMELITSLGFQPEVPSTSHAINSFVILLTALTQFINWICTVRNEMVERRSCLHGNVRFGSNLDYYTHTCGLEMYLLITVNFFFF